MSSNKKIEKIKELTQGIYVGYNPKYTVDTAVGTASRRFNQSLGTHFSHQDCVKMMKGKNIIDCGGLTAYLTVLYDKMSEAKEVDKAA